VAPAGRGPHHRLAGDPAPPSPASGERPVPGRRWVGHREQPRHRALLRPGAGGVAFTGRAPSGHRGYPITPAAPCRRSGRPVRWPAAARHHQRGDPARARAPGLTGMRAARSAAVRSVMGRASAVSPLARVGPATATDRAASASRHAPGALQGIGVVPPVELVGTGDVEAGTGGLRRRPSGAAARPGRGRNVQGVTPGLAAHGSGCTAVARARNPCMRTVHAHPPGPALRPATEARGWR
jgi:hypothetical protein